MAFLILGLMAKGQNTIRELEARYEREIPISVKGNTLFKVYHDGDIFGFFYKKNTLKRDWDMNRIIKTMENEGFQFIDDFNKQPESKILVRAGKKVIVVFHDKYKVPIYALALAIRNGKFEMDIEQTGASSRKLFEGGYN